MEKEQGKYNIQQTAFWMAILTLGAKVFGFIREMAMATFFGTNFIVDAYVISQAVPVILFGAFFTAVATAYMPLLSQRLENNGEEAGSNYTSQIMRILFGFSSASAFLGVLFSDQLVSILAPGFYGETAELTSFFLRVTFAYVIFSSLGSILDNYLQYKQTFIPQIFVLYMNNIVIIMVIVISAYTSYYFLAFGILISYGIRLLVLGRLAKVRGFHYNSSGGNLKENIKKITMLGIPVFVGSEMQQINIFVDRSLASRLPEGSIAALNYANTLNNMIMALSVTILITLIYPRLNQANARDQIAQFYKYIRQGLILIVMVALPFSLGAILYSNDLVQIVYERGAFDINASKLTAVAYLFYSAGLLFVAVNQLMLRGYYALHDTRTPMVIAGFGVIVNIVLNLLLVGPMAHGGLALATSIAAMTNSILFIIFFNRKSREHKLIDNVGIYIKIIVSSVVSVGFSKVIFLGLEQMEWLPLVVVLGLSVLMAVALYGLMLKAFHVEELQLIKKLFDRGKKS